MEHRVFGRELTNLLEHHPIRPKRNYSLLNHDRLNDLKVPVSTRNRSIIIPAAKPPAPKQDQPDPQMVPEYIHDNLHFMLAQETARGLVNNYLSKSTTITEASRAKLIDWLSQLHYKYKMFPETIFMMVALIDRYLSVTSVPLGELQLVGIAALYIAAKFQETYQVPQMKHLVSACANQYTATQIKNTEADMLHVFNFDIITDSAYKFYAPLAKLGGLEKKNMHLGQYVLELALTKPKFLDYQPSLIASACVYLIKKIRKCEQAWGDNLIRLVGYKEGQLKNCAKQLCSLLEQADGLEHCKATKKKFSLAAYHEVTRIKLQRKQSRK